MSNMCSTTRMKGLGDLVTGLLPGRGVTFNWNIGDWAAKLQQTSSTLRGRSLQSLHWTSKSAHQPLGTVTCFCGFVLYEVLSASSAFTCI